MSNNVHAMNFTLNLLSMKRKCDEECYINSYAHKHTVAIAAATTTTATVVVKRALICR